MLVLARSFGQAIVISNPDRPEDTVTLVIDRNRRGVEPVKICADAPSHIRVDRREIYERRKGGRR